MICLICDLLVHIVQRIDNLSHVGVARQIFNILVPAHTQQYELCSPLAMLQLVARLHNNSDNKKVFSMWSAPCPELNRATELKTHGYNTTRQDC
jgi:uncharacterized membrane protein YozB (DUF420 family)